MLSSWIGKSKGARQLGPGCETMSKKIAIPCPQCRQVLNVPPEYAGQRVACKRCEAVFTIVLPSASTQDPNATGESLEQLKAELDRAQTEVKTLRDEVAVQAEQIKADTVELEAALENNRTLQSQLATVSSELAEARQLRRMEQEEWSRLRSEHESRIAVLESETAEKGTDWVRLVESNDALKAQLQTTEAQLSALQSECERSRSEQTEKAAEWVRLVETHDALKVQNQSSEERLAALQAELEQTRSEHAEKEAKWVHFAGTLDELKSRLEESEERAKGLQSALEQSRAESQSFEAEVQHWKEVAHESELAPETDSEQTNAHSLAIESLQTRLDELQRLHETSISAWDVEKSALQGERDELRAKLAESPSPSSSPSTPLDEELKRLREELAAYPPMVEELKQRLETARSSENLAKSHLYQLGIRLPN